MTTVALPQQQQRSYPIAWWGMVVTIATESTIFALLLSANFFVMAQSKQWPPVGIEEPKLGLALVFSVVLWTSSLPVIAAEHAIERGRVTQFKVLTALAFVMAAAFVAYSFYDFHELHFGWRDNTYASLHYTIIGLHLAHVCVALVMSGVIQAKAWFGRYDTGRRVSVSVFSLYWHFVDVVWLFVFPAMFLAPRWVR
ncbi:MAG TPA: heme-copper oxidase subunit III [Acidimicrobiales bacterium]|nr:heme-copper oxidase subunit III [Acidimicrobiales bacterium]